MVTAIAMVMDEIDVVGQTVRRMLAQVDHVLIADNGSTDGTREALAALPVELIGDPDPAYYQSQKMTALAARAREAGARWVVPFDADEVHLPRDGGRVADVLTALPDEVLIAEAALYDHVATALDPGGNPIRRMRWRRTAAAPLPKVACRAFEDLTIHQGNHGAGYERTDHPVTVTNLLTVRHFPYRSAAQFVSKVRNGAKAYAATNLPVDVGAHWRQYGELLDAHGPAAIEDVFRTWFWSPDPHADESLTLDPCP